MGAGVTVSVDSDIGFLADVAVWGKGCIKLSVIYTTYMGQSVEAIVFEGLGFVVWQIIGT